MLYEDIDGWFGFSNIYDQVLLKDKAVIAEIGCFKGRSTAYLLERIVELKKDFQLHVVDTFLGSQEHCDIEPFKHIFLDNINKIGDLSRLIVHEGRSVDVAKSFPDQFFDLVMIDASHEYRDVLADIAAWSPKVKSGGVLAGDDYDFPGVKKAVDQQAWPNLIVYPRNLSDPHPSRHAGNNWQITI